MAKVDILNYISDSNILRSTYDTDTNELDITDVPQNLNSVITLGQGGGGATVEELNVTANGTYTAPEGKAYSPVNVSVSPDYSPLIDDSISGDLLIPTATKISSYSLFETANLTGIKGENVTFVYGYGLSKSGIKNAVLPSCNNCDANSLRECPNLEKVDINGNYAGSQGIGNNAFMNSSNFNVLVIRNTIKVMQLNASASFNGTKFASDGAGGTLYVPSALKSSYETATNWSTILGYANNSIQAIEGSIYENNYVDGSPIGA